MEEEHATFLRYAETTKINSTLFDHTNNGDTHYAVRLNGSESERIGLARSLAVMTGDTVRAEVFAKYLDPDPSNWTAALQDLMAAIAGGTAPTGTVIEAVPPSGGDGFPFAGLLDAAKANDTGIRAYLNILLFDENLGFLDAAYVPVTTAAKENGTNVPHEKLSQEIVVQQPGYAYIYFSNDNGQPLEVFFDDFTVTHSHSAIVQADDYYPFGMTFNEYRREDGMVNRFLYNQGTGEKTFRTERIEELGVDITKYRFYDYAIGRFWQVDPAADMVGQESWTPYHYGFNNPIRYSDPYGDCPTCPNWIIGLITRYAAIASPGIVAAKNIYNGSPGSTPSNIGMDNRTRTTIKVTGVASDVNTIKQTGVALAKEGSKDLANAADKEGEALSDAGLVAAPVTGGTSLALVFPGEVISAAGKTAKIGINLSEGDLDAATGEAINLGIGVATSGLTDAAIKQSRKVDNISSQAEDFTQESILTRLSSLVNKITSYVTGETLNDDEEKR